MLWKWIVLGKRFYFKRWLSVTATLALSPGGEPALVFAPHRLHLAFNDIAEPRPPLVAPDEAAVGAVLDFAGTVASGRLVVSCELGVSRSTAIAFALACRAAPGRSERCRHHLCGPS